MRLSGFSLVPLVPWLAACSTSSPFRFGLSELQEELDSQPALFTDADIAELEALRPQLPVPFRLGIAPPLGLDLDWESDWRRSSGTPRRSVLGSWDAAEVEVIEAFGRRLQEEGIISEIVLLPRFLIQQSTSDQPDALLPTLRRAAARNHVDAVLVVNRVSASQSHRTGFSFLDWTLVGAYLFPTYEVSSMSVMEAALVDTRNGYFYAAARGDGSIEGHAPAMQTESWMDERAKLARLKALRDLGEDLSVQAGLAGTYGSFGTYETYSTR